MWAGSEMTEIYKSDIFWKRDLQLNNQLQIGNGSHTCWKKRFFRSYLESSQVVMIQTCTNAHKNTEKCFLLLLIAVLLLFYFLIACLVPPSSGFSSISLVNLIHLFDITLGEAYRSATCSEDSFGESSILCLLYFLIFFLFIIIIITLVNKCFSYWNC